MHNELPAHVGLRIRGDGVLCDLFDDGTLLPRVWGGDPTATLEKEIVELRSQISKIETEESAKRAEADQVVAEIRSSDINPLTDDDAFKKIDEAYKESDELRSQVAKFRERLVRAMEIDARERGTRRDAGDPDRPENRRDPRTLGRRFNETDVVKGLRANNRLNGSSHFDTDPVEVSSRDELKDLLRQRTTIDKSNAGALVPVDQTLVTQPVNIPVRTPMLFDFVTVGDTDSDTVKTTKQTVRSDVAAETAWGTAAPEAAYAWAALTETVKRIPQFVPATLDTIADAAQLQTEIEQQLVMGVRLRAEGQTLVGDGTGENVRGILNTVGILNQPRGADTQLDAIHKAITQVRLNTFEEPTAVGLHPTDYEKLVLAKDSNGNYLFKIGEPLNVWGLPTIISPVFSAGAGVVAAWRWAWWWIRAGIEVSLSTEHADFFTRGLVAIMATLRAAFAVRQPKAFVTVTGL